MVTLEQRLSSSRVRLALVLSAIFAIPIVTFVSCMVVFPIFFFGALAVIANFAPIVIFALYALTSLGIKINREPLVHAWIFCGILWLGCAFGLSHWGGVASSMGAQNKPYLEVFLAPWQMLLKFVIGSFA